MANDAPSPEVVLRSTRLDSTGDLALVRQLFQLNGYPRSDTEMAWVYEPCCGSAGHASLAESAGSVAALYAAVSARFKVGDDEVPAAQSLAAKMAWSSIRMAMANRGSMPAGRNMEGRNSTYMAHPTTSNDCTATIQAR